MLLCSSSDVRFTHMPSLAKEGEFKIFIGDKLLTTMVKDKSVDRG